MSSLNELSGYPCPWAEHTYVVCTEICDFECRLLPIYRRHMALRQAVLGHMPARMAQETYLVAALHCRRASLYNAEDRLNALAAVVGELT